MLDELFKGTNHHRTYRGRESRAGAPQPRPHIVLAATHDIELAELLRGDGYELAPLP